MKTACMSGSLFGTAMGLAVSALAQEGTTPPPFVETVGTVEAAIRPGVVCPVTADTQVGIHRDQEDNERIWNWGSAERIKLKWNQEFCLFKFDTRACTGQQVKKATLYLPRTEQCVLSHLSISTVSTDWGEGTGKGDPGELPLDQQGKFSSGGATFTHAVYPDRLWAGPGSDFRNAVLGEGRSWCAEVRTGWARLAGQDYYWAELPLNVAQALLIPGFTHGICVAEEEGSGDARPGAPKPNPNHFVRTRESGQGAFLVVEAAAASDNAPPELVAELTAAGRPEPGALTISFKAPAPRVGRELLGYRIYVSEGRPLGAADPKLLLERSLTPLPRAPGNLQKVRLSNLTPGATCHVLITVCDSAGQESPAATCSAVVAQSVPSGAPGVSLEMTRAGITALSWDTEGTGLDELNLLRPRASAGAGFEVEVNGEWVDGWPFVVSASGAEGSLDLGSAGRAELRWTARTNGKGMVWSLANLGGTGTLSRFRVNLPFNPRMAATTVLPSRWLPPDGFALPAVLSAADFGQLLVRQQGGPAVTGRFTGDRHGKRIDVTFEFAAPKAGETITLDFSPWQLPTPKGVDEATWKSVRRGWWNMFEPCVRGHLGIGVVPAPAGVFANNPISDPVSSLYVFIADHALLIPELAPGISAEYLLRFSVEWWLDFHTNADGAIEGYENHYDMLDAPPSILIAAWACAEMSGDVTWAGGRIAQLERIADFLAARDVDQDGIIESPHSGNANTLFRPEDRGATSWDTINSGHKELYINTLAYRAFCCMADLEKRLQRNDQAARYADLAEKLKAVFFQTFHSPQTGLLSWWISADGQRHDYWAPGIQGLPIAYGLVPPDEGKRILAAIRGKVMETGFSRLDLGLPCVLTPIRRADYHLTCGAASGSPSREDGSDTFQRYLNGGCLVSDQIHWLNAHFRLGQGEAVQPQLAAMLARQGKPVFPNGGSFQNGIVNVPAQGAEFFDWNGNTSGYEGHLVYSWFFLQAVLTRQPEYLSRLYRPMNQTPPTRPAGLEPLGRLP